MTLGFYENFPTNIHRIDSFNSTLSNKQLQQKLIQVLHEVNGREFSFEEVANPTVPQGRVIFEFGLAESGDFNYIDEEETQKNTEVSWQRNGCIRWIFSAPSATTRVGAKRRHR